MPFWSQPRLVEDLRNVFDEHKDETCHSRKEEGGYKAHANSCKHDDCSYDSDRFEHELYLGRKATFCQLQYFTWTYSRKPVPTSVTIAPKPKRAANAPVWPVMTRIAPRREITNPPT